MHTDHEDKVIAEFIDLFVFISGLIAFEIEEKIFNFQRAGVPSARKTDAEHPF